MPIGRSSSMPQPALQHNVVTESPFLKFQTIQEAENKISTISYEEYERGDEPSLTHQMCLQCVVSEIDVTTCRVLDNGWGMAWYCDTCGEYLKQSKEMITTFIRGASKVLTLKKSEIRNFEVKGGRFPWVEDSAQPASLNQFFMQIGCVTRQGGISLREALGDSDFFSYPGIYSIIAGAWTNYQNFHLVATRIQGIILIRHDKKAKTNNYTHHRKNAKEQKKKAIPAPLKSGDRKVSHFHLVKSELTSIDTEAHSLTVLGEFTLNEDGMPIASTEPKITLAESMMDDRAMNGLKGRSLLMDLTGIALVKHTYSDGQTDVWSKERVRASPGLPTLDQDSWSTLAHNLSLIKRSLQRDGDYCKISLSSQNWRSTRAELAVGEQGVIDPSLLREDFREAYRI